MIDVEVVVIGSAGVWGKGSDLADAKARARKEGDLGKKIIITVAPAAAGMSVSEYGSLRWYGDTMPLYVVTAKGEKAWSSRSSAAQKLAVEETIKRLSPPTDEEVAAARERAQARVQARGWMPV